jgi:imidazolonepropionase-like amidohydrolase
MKAISVPLLRPRAAWLRRAVGAVGVVALAACASAPPSPPATSTTKAERGLDLIEAKGHAPIEAPPSPAKGRVLLSGATVWTAEGRKLSPGWVLVVDGRIAELGEGPAPTGDARVVDLRGKVLTPGLIDVHSHLGVYPSPPISATRDGNEATSPNTAGVWVEHSFWAEDPAIERAVQGGVTTMQVLPGSANLFGGRGVILHLRPMRGVRAMRFPGAPDTLKMACGENPKRVYGNRGGAPSTRMGNVRGYRDAFAQAKRWLKDNRDKPADEVARDLGMETLAGVLEGRILPEVHCYTVQDMLDFLAVADEFGFQVRAFHHALEAYKIRDILAKRQVGVATWADWWGFKLEGWDGIEEAPALIAESGGRVAIHSDSSEGIQRLNQEAAKAMYAGKAAGIAVDEEDALRWVTADAAWMLGIDGEVGTIAPGKRADLVAWDKNPMSVYARAERVWIDGVEVLDRSDPKKPRAPWSDFELGLGGAR